MGALSDTRLFFRSHLEHVAWSRRALLCLALALLPLVVALLVSQTSARVSPGELATTIGAWLQVQVVVPLLCLIAGSSAIAEEVEDRTITFVFSRPVARQALLFGRLGAILVFLTVLLALTTLGLLWISESARGSGPILDDSIRWPLLWAVLAGGVAYTTLFAVLGVFTRFPVILGVLYVLVIEALFANLPSGLQSWTVQFYLRSLILDGGSGAWQLIEGFAGLENKSRGEALLTLGCILAVALTLGTWRIRRREFVLPS